MLDINSDYDYYLITDDIGRSLIKKYFEKILDAYDKLNILGRFFKIYSNIYIWRSLH